MSMTDPIADMLTRIRNAAKAKQRALDVPASRVKEEIVRILKENDYIRDYIVLPDTRQGILRIYPKYSREDRPIMRGLRRLSRPGLRRFVSAQRVFQYPFGRQGVMIVSTSQGIMTDREAAQRKIGGEAICAVW